MGNLISAAFIVYCSPGTRHHTLLPSLSGIVMLLQESNSSLGCSCMRKTIVDSPVCEICNLADETSTHIAKLGIQQAQSADDGCLFNLTSPNHFPSKHFSTFVALCYWNLWKHRNGVIFRSEALTHQQVFRLIHNDAQLWKNRLPKKDRPLMPGVTFCYQTCSLI